MKVGRLPEYIELWPSELIKLIGVYLGPLNGIDEAKVKGFIGVVQGAWRVRALVG